MAKSFTPFISEICFLFLFWGFESGGIPLGAITGKSVSSKDALLYLGFAPYFEEGSTYTTTTTIMLGFLTETSTIIKWPFRFLMFYIKIPQCTYVIQLM